MCELLGLSAKYPATLQISLKVLSEHAHAGHADGWGMLYYEQNDGYLFREPSPAFSSPLVKLLSQCGIQSHLIISHIRKATTGAVGLRNTHPFTREVRGRLHGFAFNGDVPDIFNTGVAPKRFTPLGVTDGEFAFCYLLDQILELDDDDEEGIAAKLQSFGDWLAEMGPANFMYSDSRRLYAYASTRRHPDGEYPPGLYYLQRKCPPDGNPKPCVGLTIGYDRSQMQEITLIASVPLSEENWVPLKENQVLVAEAGHLKIRP